MNQAASVTGETMDAGRRSAPMIHGSVPGDFLPGVQIPRHLEVPVVAGAGQSAFLAALARLERWLTEEHIPYAIFGSVAASAWIDQGVSLDFERPGARDPAERIPDIDLLIPRGSLTAVQRYARAVRRGGFPVSIDTFWSECWIDFRPGTQLSYLTHRQVRLPVPTGLFTPTTAPLLGQDVTALDPRTLLHLYGAVGVVRRKDAPRITGLAEAIASGAATSRFTEQDCQVFASFMLARNHRYPLFFASKRAWTLLLDAVPPGVAQALRHHVQLPANEVFRVLNHRRGRWTGSGRQGQGDARNSLAHNPM